MNFNDNRPIYLQIAERIIAEILQDKYTADERIPSVRECAAGAGVNANTVARSFDYLQNKEIIYNKRGIGYFVSTDAKAKIVEIHKEDFINNEIPDMLRKMQLLGIPFEEVTRIYNQIKTSK